MNIAKLICKSINGCIAPTALFLLLFKTAVSWAKFDIRDIKGLSTPLGRQYQNLSPVPGIAWSEGNILANISKTYPPTDVISKLIGELYHYVGSEFIPVQAPFKMASYLHPKLIGKIVASLEKLREGKSPSKKEQKVQIKALEEILFNDPTVREKIDKNKEKAREVLQKIKGLQEKEKAASLTESEKQALSNYIDDFNLYFPFVKADISKVINDPEKYIKKIYDESMKKNASLLARNLYDLNKRPPADNPMVFRMLGALLWDRTNSKEEYLDYYLGISEIHPPQYIINQSSLKRDAPWLKEKFNDLDAQRSISFEDDEMDLYRAYRHNRSQVGLLSYKRPKAPSGDGNFPDCGETSIRNFFNLLLFENGKVDPTILNRMKGHLPVELVDFYKKFSTVNSQLTIEAHHEWGRVVSGLPGVKYKKRTGETRYEIAGESSGQNMLSVLRGLLDIKKKMNWEETMAYLQKISGRQIKIIKSESTVVIGKSITFEMEGVGTYRWRFMPHHYVIDLVASSEGLEVQRAKDRSKLLSRKHGNFGRETDLLSFYPISSIMVKKILKEIVESTSRGQKVDDGCYKLTLMPLQVNTYVLHILEMADKRQLKLPQETYECLYNMLTNNSSRISFLEKIPPKMSQYFQKDLIDTKSKGCKLGPFFSDESITKDQKFSLYRLLMAFDKIGKCNRVSREYFSSLTTQKQVDVMSYILKYNPNKDLLIELFPLILGKIDLHLRADDRPDADVSMNKYLLRIYSLCRKQKKNISSLEAISNIVKKISAKFPKTSKDPLLFSLLNMAAYTGSLDILDELLKIEGVKEKLKKMYGDRSSISTLQAIKRKLGLGGMISNPLYLAVREGNFSVVKRLLETKLIDPNQRMGRENITPLMVSIDMGYKNIFNLLLNDPRVDVNMSRRSGQTPLQMAIQLNEHDMVQELLRHPNIDVNKREGDMWDMWGRTPLHMAAQEGASPILYEMLKDPRVDREARFGPPISIASEDPFEVAKKRGDRTIVESFESTALDRYFKFLYSKNRLDLKKLKMLRRSNKTETEQMKKLQKDIEKRMKLRKDLTGYVEKLRRENDQAAYRTLIEKLLDEEGVSGHFSEEKRISDEHERAEKSFKKEYRKKLKTFRKEKRKKQFLGRLRGFFNPGGYDHLHHQAQEQKESVKRHEEEQLRRQAQMQEMHEKIESSLQSLIPAN